MSPRGCRHPFVKLVGARESSLAIIEEDATVSVKRLWFSPVRTLCKRSILNWRLSRFAATGHLCLQIGLNDEFPGCSEVKASASCRLSLSNQVPVSWPQMA
jgi:hypothetical protein